jgi:hypothetical protein
MFPNFIIALVASIAWLVRDYIQQGHLFSIKANWKKYVGCLIAGYLYSYVAKVPFFQYVAIIGVIALVGNSFSDVVNAINWILGKLGSKAKI